MLSKIRILIAHNAYQQRGGEDVVFEQESSMLSSAGFPVRRFTVRNDHIQGFADKVVAAGSVISNKASIAALCNEIDEFSPDVVHIHNFFPTLSPAAVGEVARRGIPVVLTLHNYRLICPGALLLRDGKPCEDCVGHSKISAAVHGCYRGSRIGSTAVAMMGSYFKKIMKMYPNSITLVALTHFGKSRFVADGFAAQSIWVRGNAIADPGDGLAERQRRIVYVGRLSREKGVDTLLEAAQGLDGVIEVIGDGPERARLERIAPSNVVFRGQLGRALVLERIKSATALAIPSRWYEGFPLAALESMATGTPVLASNIGALGELVVHGKTGLLLPPGVTIVWREAIESLFHDPESGMALGVQAREHFLQSHSFKTGVKQLAEIYEAALVKINKAAG